MPLAPLTIVHVNANCSNLARSLAFYREFVGLTPLVHTNPRPQSGEGFGLEGEVQWDAHLLYDDRGFGGPALDLLEWKSPLPVGRPPRDANHLGYFRLCLSHPDVDALHAILSAAGVACRSAPVSVPVLADQTLRFFCCEDPDGTTVEFIEMPGASRLLHVNLNCLDLERSTAFYRDVVGLAPIAERAEPGPCDGAGFGFDGPCDYRADFLVVPGAEAPFIVDLLEWKQPRPVGKPPEAANHLGLFRLAFLVEDAAASCAELDRLGVPNSGPCWLDISPELPADELDRPEVPSAGLNAVFFRDPDGTCLELIEAAAPPT